MLRLCLALAALAAAGAYTVNPAVHGLAPRSSSRCYVLASAADARGPKAALLDAVNSESLSVAPTADKSMELSEAVLALSTVNPTDEPARSPLINGRWDLAYAGAPDQGLLASPTRLLALALYATPLSPSVLAQGLASLPFDAASLGPLTITIVSAEAGQPRVAVDTSVTVLGGTPQPVTLRANLLPRSGYALREEFVEVEALGQRSLLPGPLALSRSLYITYLDDDLMITRDETGLPAVLRRAEKFPIDSGPSYDNDDDAPGAG